MKKSRKIVISILACLFVAVTFAGCAKPTTGTFLSKKHDAIIRTINNYTVALEKGSAQLYNGKKKVGGKFYDIQATAYDKLFKVQTSVDSGWTLLTDGGAHISWGERVFTEFEFFYKSVTTGSLTEYVCFGIMAKDIDGSYAVMDMSGQIKSDGYTSVSNTYDRYWVPFIIAEHNLKEDGDVKNKITLLSESFEKIATVDSSADFSMLSNPYLDYGVMALEMKEPDSNENLYEVYTSKGTKVSNALTKNLENLGHQGILYNKNTSSGTKYYKVDKEGSSAEYSNFSNIDTENINLIKEENSEGKTRFVNKITGAYTLWSDSIAVKNNFIEATNGTKFSVYSLDAQVALFENIASYTNNNGEANASIVYYNANNFCAIAVTDTTIYSNFNGNKKSYTYATDSDNKTATILGTAIKIKDNDADTKSYYLPVSEKLVNDFDSDPFIHQFFYYVSKQNASGAKEYYFDSAKNIASWDNVYGKGAVSEMNDLAEITSVTYRVSAYIGQLLEKGKGYEDAFDTDINEYTFKVDFATVSYKNSLEETKTKSVFFYYPTYNAEVSAKYVVTDEIDSNINSVSCGYNYVTIKTTNNYYEVYKLEGKGSDATLKRVYKGLNKPTVVRDTFKNAYIKVSVGNKTAVYNGDGNLVLDAKYYVNKIENGTATVSPSNNNGITFHGVVRLGATAKKSKLIVNMDNMDIELFENGDFFVAKQNKQMGDLYNAKGKRLAKEVSCSEEGSFNQDFKNDMITEHKTVYISKYVITDKKGKQKLYTVSANEGNLNCAAFNFAGGY